MHESWRNTSLGLDLKSRGPPLRRITAAANRHRPPNISPGFPFRSSAAKSAPLSLALRQAESRGARGRETMRLIDDDRSPCSEFGQDERTQESSGRRRGKRPLEFFSTDGERGTAPFLEREIKTFSTISRPRDQTRIQPKSKELTHTHKSETFDEREKERGREENERVARARERSS